MALEAFALIGRIALEGADTVTRGLDTIGRRSQGAGRQMESFGTATNRAMDQAANSTEDMESAVRNMRNEMREAMNEQRRVMQPFRLEQMRVQQQYWELSRSTEQYKGRTQDLFRELERLGRAQRTATDNMMAHNNMARAGLLQSVGAMMAMSTQSEKIIKNYDRMGNVFYTVNNGLLNITHGLERIAKAGAPAAVALRLLGADANMKDLQSMIGLINRGLMRMAAVAVAAGLALAGMTAALANAAHGEAPAKIREQMAEIEGIYQKALADRREELYQWASIFEDIEFKPPDPAKLIAILDEQVKIFDNWAKNLQTLLDRGLDAALVKNLEKLGPKAAAEVQSLTKMTDKQLQEYENLWHRRQSQANEKAISELENLRQQTDAKIKQLKESITPLALAWERFKNTWAAAVAPFVESWGRVAAKVVDAGTAIGEFFEKLNQNDMDWVIKAAGWFIYLFTALTLLLSPLAIGVGLMGGFLAAWGMVAPIVMPLITGFAAMAGTITLVIAAAAGIIAIIKLIIDGFRNWINSSEEVRAAVTEKFERMREGVKGVADKLKGIWTEGMAMIKRAIAPVLEEIQKFWSEHGMQVLQAVENVMGFLMATFNFVFPFIRWIVLAALNAILGIFRSVFGVIMGIVKVFTGLFTGDFSLMWEGVKQLFLNAVLGIWHIMNLMFIGRLVKGIGALFTVLKSIFKGGLDTIRLNFMYFVDGIKNWLTNLKNLWTTSFTALKNTGLSIFQSIRGAIEVAMGAIRTKVLDISTKIYLGAKGAFDNLLGAVRTVFNNIQYAMTNPIGAARNAISGAISGIKSMFNNLKLKLPRIATPHFRIVNWSLNPKDWIKARPRIDIDWYKEGAFFDQATVLSGLGERGTEAIIPIQNRRYMQPFSQAIAENLQDLIQHRQGARLEVPVVLNGREIVRAIIADLDRELARKQHRQSGLVNRGNL